MLGVGVHELELGGPAAGGLAARLAEGPQPGGVDVAVADRIHLHVMGSTGHKRKVITTKSVCPLLSSMHDFQFLLRG